MYRWAVYLDNKCSEEQPKAWSVVGKFEIKKNPEILYHGADLTEETPPQRTVRQIGMFDTKAFVSVIVWPRFSQSCVSPLVPFIWPKQRLQRLLFPLTVWTQGPAHSEQSCKTEANQAHCLQRQGAQFWASAVNNLHDGERAKIVLMVVMMTTRYKMVSIKL